MYNNQTFASNTFVGARYPPPLAAPPSIDPRALNPHHGGRRRASIGDLTISPRSVTLMNSAIGQICHQYQYIDIDELVTLARWTQKYPEPSQQFIHDKKQFYQAIKWMVCHPFWETPPEDKEIGQFLINYFQTAPQPIPDPLPGYGLIDNALVIHEVTPALNQSLSDIIDFLGYCQWQSVDANERAMQQWNRWLERKISQWRPVSYVADRALPQYARIG